jgi:proline iminopeptidase
MPPYPPLQPHDHGMLPVGDGHHVYWETSGNPHGKPAVLLHGGPGAGTGNGWRRLFDPAVYRIVIFDQRNCGRSTPHASAPVIDLSTNTTQHLIADLERLRTHLAIDKWLVFAASWGTTLGLAYAQRFPHRVSEMVLWCVTATRHRDVAWITREMGRIFPREWERFRDGVPERDGNLAAAYSRLLHDADPAVRDEAAKRWCEWEDVHVSLAPGQQPFDSFKDPAFRLAFARLTTHYWANAAFLADDELLKNVAALGEIPATLIQGRHDISGPAEFAWNLAKQWPAAELTILEEAGHGTGMIEHVIAATDRFRAT